MNEELNENLVVTGDGISSQADNVHNLGENESLTPELITSQIVNTPTEATTTATVDMLERITDELDEIQRVPVDTTDNSQEEEVHQEIPVNSESLNIDDTSSRFSSAIWYDKVRSKDVTLAGLGGIGSYVGFLLSRVKPNTLYLYDDDEVESANMSGQLYSDNDIGNKKVLALASTIADYSEYRSVVAFPNKFTEESVASDIMICGFDNMESRDIFFRKWFYHVSHTPIEKRSNCLFIDGRLAAEEFQILCIRGDDDYNKDRYIKEFMFKDEEAEETICSYKQTSYCATMIASYIVNLFVNFCANQCNPLIERDLPFLTTYNAETMYFKTES